MRSFFANPKLEWSGYFAHNSSARILAAVFGGVIVVHSFCGFQFHKLQASFHSISGLPSLALTALWTSQVHVKNFSAVEKSGGWALQ